MVEDFLGVPLVLKDDREGSSVLSLELSLVRSFSLVVDVVEVLLVCLYSFVLRRCVLPEVSLYLYWLFDA